LNAAGLDTRALASSKIAAIGKSTANRLNEFGISADMIPENESSAGLLEKFEQIDIKDKKILIPQAQIASNQLQQGLSEAGADVEAVAVYKTVEIDPGEIDFDYIDKILFTSGSTITAFVKKFTSVPDHIKSYCLGQPTLEEAKKHNIEAEVLS